jgi:Asp/Glu/hydantoin racemase
MRLWYQSLARQTESTPYGTILKDVIESCADPGTTVHVQGVGQAAGIGVHYRFLEYHDMRDVIYNAIRAEKEGYDGFLIGNITDAGIREARELVSETSFHLASIMGPNFGLVTISEKWTPRILESVRRYGLETRLAGVEPIATSPLELKKAMVNTELRDAVIADFMAAAKRLLARGAETVVPAGGDIIVFLAQAGLYVVDRAPIVNGIVELIKMGETAVKLKALTGRFTSKRLQYCAPTGDFLQRVRAFYGDDVYPGAK